MAGGSRAVWQSECGARRREMTGGTRRPRPAASGGSRNEPGPDGDWGAWVADSAERVLARGVRRVLTPRPDPRARRLGTHAAPSVAHIWTVQRAGERKNRAVHWPAGPLFLPFIETILPGLMHAHVTPCAPAAAAPYLSPSGEHSSRVLRASPPRRSPASLAPRGQRPNVCPSPQATTPARAVRLASCCASPCPDGQTVSRHPTTAGRWGCPDGIGAAPLFCAGDLCRYSSFWLRCLRDPRRRANPWQG